ncbi:hypothetical protein EDB84DRAFT_1675894 [Lactarius hengduanensis]|nr:hypothetical protein EDB84DRAFT_1675894 [Lactarius hengduanensis]
MFKLSSHTFQDPEAPIVIRIGRRLISDVERTLLPLIYPIVRAHRYTTLPGSPAGVGASNTVTGHGSEELVINEVSVYPSVSLTPLRWTSCDLGDRAVWYQAVASWTFGDILLGGRPPPRGGIVTLGAMLAMALVTLLNVPKRYRVQLRPPNSGITNIELYGSPPTPSLTPLRRRRFVKTSVQRNLVDVSFLSADQGMGEVLLVFNARAGAWWHQALFKLKLEFAPL